MEENAKYETEPVETKEILPAIQQDSFFIAIERLAANPDVDVEKIKQIMDMQEHILDRNAKQAFNAAMVKAQANMRTVPKDLKNTQTGSMYSGYETILKYCQPIYTKEGFSVTFSQGFATPENPLKEGHNRVVADIMHEEGYTKTVFVDIPVETTGPKGGVLMTKTHATGSAFSYGRSYLIRLIFNIPTGDEDDGNAASGIAYVNEKQLRMLERVIKANKIDKTKFLKYLKVESLEELPAKDFNKALTAAKTKNS